MNAPYHDVMARAQATDRADSAVCAAVLRTSLVWWGWMILCGLTLVGLSLAHGAGAWVWLGLAWPLWLAGTWLTMRLLLDAALFTGLSQAAGPASTGPSLDGALTRVLRVQPRLAADGAPRTLAARVAGAMRLFRMLVAVCVAHGSLLLALVLQRVFNG